MQLGSRRGSAVCKHQSLAECVRGQCPTLPRPHCSCYESVPGGMDEVRRRVEDFMGQFNEASRALKMELVLFKGGGKTAGRRAKRLSRLSA